MKKLALIVLLAVVASRLLADREDRPDRPAHPHPSVVSWVVGDDSPAPPRPPELPPAINIVPWHGGAPDGAPAPKRGPKARRRGPTSPAASDPAPAPGVVPAWFPKGEWEEEDLARPNPAGMRVLVGRLSASPERARADLRKTVGREIGDWLAADVPPTWTPPQKLVDRMTAGSYVRSELRTLGGNPAPVAATPADATTPSIPELDEPQVFYRAGQKLDFSDNRRDQFVEAYRRDVASARMKKSGSLLAVVLAGLLAVSLYVRADEATKGYYTNRLRALAAVGLGAAGAVAYRYWA